MVGDLLVAEYLKDASSSVRIHRLDGGFVREVEFPGIGTASGFSGSRSDLETFYSFSSYAQPPTIYRYDMLTGESTVMRQAEVKFDPADYVTEQVFYTSKDGTRIPMLITHKKGLVKDGSNATLLYGYGGFDISITPAFSVRWLTWMDLGGVLAVPNLRADPLQPADLLEPQLWLGRLLRPGLTLLPGIGRDGQLGGAAERRSLCGSKLSS
jgi:prolyl oligopeptidase